MGLPQTQEELDQIVKERLARDREVREKEFNDKLDKVKAENATQVNELKNKVTEYEAKLKDADTWKASHEKLPSIQQQLNETADKLKSNEGAGEALQKTLDAFIAKIPEDNRHRIPEGVAPDALLRWIVANDDLVLGKGLGVTPPGDSAKPGNANTDLILGKYATEKEFAHAEPQAYREWATQQPVAPPSPPSP